MMRLSYLSFAVLMGLTLAFPTTHLQAQDSLTPTSSTPQEAASQNATPIDDAATRTPVPPSDSPEGKGLLGRLRVGPTVSVAFPHLLNGSLEAVWDERFALSAQGGRSKLDTAKFVAEVYNWDVRARWFPWQGSFFLGAAYGNLGLVGKTSKDLSYDSNGLTFTIPTTIRVGAETAYVLPHAGWMARWDSGFTLGFLEFGYQMPLGAKSTLQNSFQKMPSRIEADIKASKDYKDAETEIQKIVDLLGRTGIPYINLLRIGWLF